MFMVDIFTAHGKYKEVPDVKNMPLREAISKLEDAGFKWEISDSTYNDNYQPGAVIEQDPKAHTNVKALRLIYLTINSITPREVVVPSLVDLSFRQGKSMLEGLGFKNIQVQIVPSPYKELILSISANGRQIEPGTKLPVSTHIVITIGDGAEETPGDSITIDETQDNTSAEGNDGIL